MTPDTTSINQRHTQPDEAVMMDLVRHLWPLHRTLVSDDMDKAMEIIGEYLPDEGEYVIHGTPSGTRVWTWTVPEKFVVNEAYLELLTDDGPQRIVDFADNPLHIVSYSPPFEGELDFAVLDAHLHTSTKRPNAIPWVFKYYERDWGFCLTQRAYEELPRDGRYRAVMDTRFDEGNLRVGEFTLAGEGSDFLLIVCAVCHPMQVNDSISGVAAAVDFARRRAGQPKSSIGLKILFVPEVIGSVAYLAANEHMIPRFRCAIISEFIGHDGPLRLQRTRQDTHQWDRISRRVLQDSVGEFIEGAFCSTIITNDEKVTNAPGVDIPTIALNRWPDEGWDRYHTSDDNPSIINPARLAEVSKIYDDLLDVLATNVYPRRTFMGPLFLSGVGLDFDWQSEPSVKMGVRELTLHLEGDKSAVELAEICNLDYRLVISCLDAMAAKGLVELSGAPWT